MISIFDNNFVCANRVDNYRTRFPHMGVAYILAVLKKANIACKVMDMNLGYSKEEVIDFIHSESPSFICITIFSAGYMRAYTLVEYLRSRFDGAIVLGGPHVSVVKNKVLKHTAADYAFIGEGEYGLIELVQGKRLEQIRGLIWRNGPAVIENEKRPYIKNLDELPFPAFYDFELERYLCFADHRLPIITSRGCPYSCNYCCTPLCMGKGFRARSPMNVVDEIEYWYRRGWYIFDINDDVFSVQKQRAKRICELILERSLDIQLNLYVGLRVDNIETSLLESLAEAGCRFISYGCEAGSDRMLKRIKKGIQKKDVIRAVVMTRKTGINCKVNFIIGHFMEQYRDALYSIKLAKHLIRLGCKFVGFNNMIPYPGTEIYSWIQNNPKARFIYPPDVYLNDLTHKKLNPVFETDDFLIKERIKALKKGFKLENRTLAGFRFGKYKGYIVYLLGLNKYIFKLSQWFFGKIVSTNVGYIAYKRLIKSPWQYKINANMPADLKLMYKRNNINLVGCLEITEHCNQRCQHCYNSPKRQQELTLSEMI